MPTEVTKMLKKILGVVLIVLGAGLAFAFFTSTADETQAAHFNKAVYVQDALTHAENEGKVIIVPGKPVLFKKATDPELRIALETPLLVRTVEIYKLVPLTEKDKQLVKYKNRLDKMWWEKVDALADKDTYRYRSTSFAGALQVGEFLVQGKYLLHLPRTDYHGFTQADAANLSLKLQNDNGRQYLSQTLFTNDDNAWQGRNSLRFSYEYTDLNKMDTYTLVGKQKGRELLYEDGDFNGTIMEGIKTKDEVLQAAAKSRKLGNIVGYVVTALLLVGGGYLTFFSKNE